MSVLENRTFVEKWLEAFKESKTQVWVAQELEITPSAVTAKKKKLMEAGVELPPLKRVTENSVDAEDLNALVHESLNA